MPAAGARLGAAVTGRVNHGVMAWILCVLLLGVAGCREESRDREAPPERVPALSGRTPTGSAGLEVAGDTRRVVVAWLECGECRDGEFEALRKLGPAVFPLLEGALERGPAPAALAARRLQLERSYRGLREYAGGRRGMNIELDEEPYVETQLGSWVALYRLRAGQGLLALEAPGASLAVRRALESDLRADAKRALRAELEDPGRSPWR